MSPQFVPNSTKQVNTLSFINFILFSIYFSYLHVTQNINNKTDGLISIRGNIHSPKDTRSHVHLVSFQCLVLPTPSYSHFLFNSVSTFFTNKNGFQIYMYIVIYFRSHNTFSSTESIAIRITLELLAAVTLLVLLGPAELGMSLAIDSQRGARPSTSVTFPSSSAVLV